MTYAQGYGDRSGGEVMDKRVKTQRPKFRDFHHTESYRNQYQMEDYHFQGVYKKLANKAEPHARLRVKRTRDRNQNNPQHFSDYKITPSEKFFQESLRDRLRQLYPSGTNCEATY